MTRLSSNQISAFVQAFLLDKYNSPVPIPEFHKEMWNKCTSGAKRVVICAPRGHAKSTAITHALTLALFLFRKRRYGLIVSDTEGQASLFLGDIKSELENNQELRDMFGIKRLVKDAVTDIIVECDDGHLFRIQALGAEQKVRGRKWMNLRPDYIVGDDLENDEMVENDDRRKKFKNWFSKALMPCLSKDGMIVIIGTIPHMDSILVRLFKNKEWEHLFYKAHESFSDFSNILWPQMWSEEELREKQRVYINDGIPEGYAQEYLNDPIAHSEAFFKREDFQPYEEGMERMPTTNYAGIDFAISDADNAAYTVITVGGMDAQKRLIIKKVIRFRGDGNDILNTIFAVQEAFNIEMWVMEKGQILLTLQGEMYERMNRTGIYLNIYYGTPTKDKRSRARPIQARMRAGGVYFPIDADWFPVFQQELIQFPKGMYKDQVDSISWLGIIINKLNEGPTKEELDEESYYEQMAEFESNDSDRNSVTGY